VTKDTFNIITIAYFCVMKKGDKIYSVIKNKCPKCHEGAYFKSSNPYNFFQLGKTHERCSVCNQSYSPETGFYFGAAYVSYAIGVAIFVAIWVATSVLYPTMSVHYQVGIVVAAIVVLFPVNFYLSRLIWINMFVKYEKR
jgi:uncharacterized protein (DUF983 family)